MTTGFAGSRNLDERRRRRLAIETENGSPALPASVRSDVGDADLAERAPKERAALLAQALVPAKLWVYWNIGVLCALLGGGILCGAYYAAVSADVLGPGFTRLFALPGGRLLTCFSTALLFAAGELAFLIWWVRANCPRDFAGRYRFWPWVGVTWFLFALAIATDAHLALSETIVWRWNIPIWQRETLAWLAPALVVGGVLLWMLHCEMGDSHGSRTMVWLAAVCCLTSAALTLLPQTAGGTLPWELLQAGVGLCGHVCLFLAMSVHARHVVHVTSDPPKPPPAEPPKPARRRRWPSLPRFSWPRFRRRDVPAETAQPAEHVEKRPAALAEKPAPPRTKPAERPATQPALTKDKVPATNSQRDSDRQKSTVPVKSSPPVAKTSPPTEMRIDPPAERPDLKGLSKRERRKLQKEFREQERADVSE